MIALVKMPWRDNVGTQFVLRSSDASNDSNLGSDEVPFLQPTQDDVNDQIASLADDLSGNRLLLVNSRYHKSVNPAVAQVMDILTR